MDINTLKQIANERRADALQMIHDAGTGHTGGALSALDILTCLHYDVMDVRPDAPHSPDRDRFLLSKGHSVEGYYAILADLGFFPKAWLKRFSAPGSPLIGHPNNKVPGVELCTGALGHGLSAGVGIALGALRTGKAFRTYVLMGDGEQAEGSVWEAAMAASHYRLGNLYAIVDRNGLQISGPTEDVLAIDDLADKWRAFNWDVETVDGNCMDALRGYFTAPRPEGKPHMLIARTIKGKGLPCAENRPSWHHKVPNDEELREGLRALCVKERDFA